MEETSKTARSIWNAAVQAVRSDQLVAQSVRIDSSVLCIGAARIRLDSFDRLIVVGAGKATAGMARGLHNVVQKLRTLNKQVVGWINVPEDCVDSIEPLTVFPARPAGLNEPTLDAVYGTSRIMELLTSTTPRDLTICLISGGGSALLVAPPAGVTLEEKIHVTKLLSSGGANIQQLNTVRKQLSQVKGNGLARACRGGQLFSLVISDVIGDPLDVIASGPTVPNTTGPDDALRILTRFDPDRKSLAPSVYRTLEAASSTALNADTSQATETTRATNIVIGNLNFAVDAAFAAAKLAGLDAHSSVATAMESDAEAIGERMADQILCRAMTAATEAETRQCFIEGGEPTVRLVKSSRRGKGGRNQQLVLAALHRIVQSGVSSESLPPFCILSGGTDGEDGPTDAAGAFIDNATISRVKEIGIDAADYLQRNDAWSFFRITDNLIVTGPTHTNVCDIRVMIV